MHREYTHLEAIDFYAHVGVAMYGHPRCAVSIDTQPVQIFRPRADQSHMVVYAAKFRARRKVPYALLLGELMDQGITPMSKPLATQFNPDPHAYYDLPIEHLELIIATLTRLITAISSSHSLRRIPVEEQIAAERQRRAAHLDINNHAFVIAGPAATTVVDPACVAAPPSRPALTTRAVDAGWRTRGKPSSR